MSHVPRMCFCNSPFQYSLLSTGFMFMIYSLLTWRVYLQAVRPSANDNSILISMLLVLLSQVPLSPAPSGDQSHHCKRPQRLFLDGDSQKPSFHFSPSSSSSSPQSPQPPHGALSWESPKLKHHSYMNPTASSMAKSSRSSSVGEGMQTPPCSPCFHRSRRSFGESETEVPVSASSPLSPGPRLSSCPQSAGSHSTMAPAAAVPPRRPVQNVQPSRIPLPKQSLSPRRSLCLEVMPSCRDSTASTGPGGDATPVPGKQGWRQLDYNEN